MATRDERRAAEREPLINPPTSDPARLQKEASIHHKLRTYEAILALRAGCMPGTDQLLHWARYAMRSSGVLDSRNRSLSSPGRQFVRDLRAWIEAVADLAEQKNGDDKIQDFLYHTSRAQISTELPSAGASVTDIHQLYSRLRLLFGLLYSSPEFRKLANDFTIIARDMFADAASLTASYASHAAEKAQSTAAQVRPSEDELAHLDEPAPTPPTNEQGEGAATSHFESGKAAGGRIPSRAELKRQAAEKSRTYAEEARRKTYAAGSEIEEYLKQKFPKQRRDAVVNRLKTVVADVQSNPDFQEAFEFIGSLMSDYIAHIKDTILQQGSKKTQLQYDEHFTMALQRGREIIQAFAGGKSLDSVRDALAEVIGDVENDPDLNNFWEDVADFFKKMIKEPGYATTDAADAEAHELFDRSKYLLETKTDAYRPHIEKLFNSVNAYTTAIQNNKGNKRVVEASKKVWNDLVVPDRYGGAGTVGGYRFRTRVVRDMFDILLPKLISEIKYIPLPRIEYQDKDYDLILENVVLESDHFLPNRLLFEAHTRAEYTSAQTFTPHYSGYTRLSIQQLTLTLRDTSFIIRKKTGMIPFSDRGYFDLDLTLSLEIILDKANYDEYFDDDVAPDSWFHVRSVSVHVDRFKYKYNAYHSWAAALCAPVVRPAVRRLVERVAVEKVRAAVEAIDREGHALVERMRVATIASQGGGSLEAWIRAVLSRPEGVGRRRATRGGRGGGVGVQRGERGVRLEGGGSGRGEGFVVTIGAEEELFPGEHGPGAILAKVGASEERVGEGEMGGWRNSIFDVGA